MMKNKPTFGLALLPVAIALAGQAISVQAEDTQLTNMVVSAAGYEQKLVDAPASISVITQEELRSRPFTNLLDALRYMEGIDLGTGQDKSGQGSISMRGLGSDYTLILVDGRRQNNNGDLYPNNFGGFQSSHIPPIDMIERIEVVRGPMSTLYGADAMGGVVNIITKKVSDKWHASLSTSYNYQENDDYGNTGTTDLSVSGPLIKGLLGLGLRGSYYDKQESNPEYAVSQDPAGNPYQPSSTFGGGRSADNVNWTGGFRLNLTPNDKHEIIFDYDESNQKYDNSESQFGSVSTVDNIYAKTRTGYATTQRTSREQMYLSHIGQWDFGRTEVTLTKIETRNDGRDLPLTAEERKELQQRKANDSQADVENWIADNLLPRPNRNLSSQDLILDAKVELPLDSHFVVLGTQVVDGKMTDGAFGMVSTGYNPNTEQENKTWSLFAEDSWALTSNFTLTTGLRYDDHNMFDGHFSPRLYGVYQVAQDWTIKGGVSTGYKTPKTSDLYPGITGFGGQGTSPWVGNPDLKPETSVNSELAVYFSSLDGHSFNATAFYTEFKDKIQTIDNCQANPTGNKACANIDPWWTSSTGGKYKVSYKGNVSEAQIYGVELAGKYVIGHGVSLKANYTFMDSEVTEGPAKGRPLTGDPTSASSSSADTPAKHMANINLDWQANEDLNMYVGMYAESGRVRGWDDFGNFLPDYKSYQVYHLGALYQLTKNVSLSARVNNLFNEDFTTYEVQWEQTNNGWEDTRLNDYKVIDKSRNYWLSMNVAF